MQGSFESCLFKVSYKPNDEVVHKNLFELFIRDARPRFDCILEKNEENCLKALQDDGADILVMAGERVYDAIKNYNVKPIVGESYGIGETEFSERAAVAVIKRGSYIKSLRN